MNQSHHHKVFVKGNNCLFSFPPFSPHIQRMWTEVAFFSCSRERALKLLQTMSKQLVKLNHTVYNTLSENLEHSVIYKMNCWTYKRKFKLRPEVCLVMSRAGHRAVHSVRSHPSFAWKHSFPEQNTKICTFPHCTQCTHRRRDTETIISMSFRRTFSTIGMQIRKHNNTRLPRLSAMNWNKQIIAG